MKALSPKLHGILDYLIVAFLWISPYLFTFSHIMGTFTYVLGGIHLLLTICTDFEYGIFKVISFKIHSRIELIVSILLFAVGFYFYTLGNDAGNRFYLYFAPAVLFIWLITDYHSLKKVDLTNSRYGWK